MHDYGNFGGHPTMTPEQEQAWPRYFCNRPHQETTWSDGVVYIEYLSPTHSRGINARLETVWENDLPLDEFQAWTWYVHQVSPLYVAYLVHKVNSSK